MSGIAAIANFGSRLIASEAMPYALAICVAYVIGMLVAFVLNRRFVFDRSSKSTRTQIFRFVMVNAFALLQTLTVSLLLAAWMLPRLGIRFHVEEIAHAVGIAVPAITSYLAHKHWTFS